MAQLSQALRSASPAQFAGLVVFGLLCVLRFYGLFHYDYANDELSALFRTQLDSFSELITKGIAPDGHPALVQVWLFYWVQLGDALFGEGINEIWVRTPFVLAGLAAIWLLFRLLTRRFGAESALLFVCMVIGLEYFQVFGIQARPYAVGALWVAWLVDAVDRMLYLPDREGNVPKPSFGGRPQGSPLHNLLILNSVGATLAGARRRTVIEIALATALCFYTHYFAALTALVIGLVAIALNIKAKRTESLWLLAGGVAGSALFLPHLWLTLRHMSEGGLGWLGPPKWHHIIDYWQEAANHSLVLALLFGGLVLMGLFWKDSKHRERIWLISSFAVVYVVGFTWSWLSAPVLHMGALYFAYPLAMMCAASAVASLHKQVTYALCAIILIISLYTGWFSGPLAHRPAYTSFDRLAQRMVPWQQEHSPQSIFWAGSATQPWYFLNYLQRWQYPEPAEFQFFGLHNLKDVAAFGRALNQAEQPSAVLLWGNQHLPPEALATLLYYRPQIKAACWEPYGGALLATGKAIDSHTFELQHTNAEFAGDIRLAAQATRQTSPAIVYAWVEIMNDVPDMPLPEGLALVLELKWQGRTLCYTASAVADFAQGEKPNKLVRVFAAHYVPALVPAGAEWHAYLWNPTKGAFQRTEIQLKRGLFCY